MQVLAWAPEAPKRARAALFEGPRADRAFRVATAAIVIVGLWFRVRGFLFSTTAPWLDEVIWAVELMEKPLLDDLIRPIGFMAVTRALARVFGPSETVLRFLPWCAGVATTLMAPALAARLFRSGAARLLFVAVLALHPGAIDLSKEFKPYSVSLALHAGVVLLALRYCDGGKRRDLAGVLALATVSVLFAQDVMFAYPGLFLVLAITALRSRRFRHFAAVAFAAALSLGLVIALYAFMWSRMDHGKEETYWGKKYDVFYTPGKQDKAIWTARHYAQIAAMPGARRAIWASGPASEDRLNELRSVDSVLWIVLHGAGLALIARTRRLREATLLVMPLAVTTALNALGFWPLGEFRTDLFALLYAAAIAAFGVERNARRIRWEDFIPAAVLVIAPLLAFERVWHSKKTTYTATGEYREMLTTLLHLQARGYPGHPERLIADSWTRAAWRYYTNLHPRYSVTLGRKLNERFELLEWGKHNSGILKSVRAELRKSPDRVWVAVMVGSVLKKVERHWPTDVEQLMLRRGPEDTYLLIAATAKAPDPEPPRAPESKPDDAEADAPDAVLSGP